MSDAQRKKKEQLNPFSVFLGCLVGFPAATVFVIGLVLAGNNNSGGSFLIGSAAVVAIGGLAWRWISKILVKVNQSSPGTRIVIALFAVGLLLAAPYLFIPNSDPLGFAPVVNAFLVAGLTMMILGSAFGAALVALFVSLPRTGKRPPAVVIALIIVIISVVYLSYK